MRQGTKEADFCHLSPRRTDKATEITRFLPKRWLELGFSRIVPTAGLICLTYFELLRECLRREGLRPKRGSEAALVSVVEQPSSRGGRAKACNQIAGELVSEAPGDSHRLPPLVIDIGSWA